MNSPDKLPKTHSPGDTEKGGLIKKPWLFISFVRIWGANQDS
jgi:hypothetical protein